ncbi:hypothetical protein M0R45_004545 [Rubus argutus]|uniref:Uncharacterized protein n=1 Tax=Rubus argutus TaxID=59490 RepID=A0AAW1YK17_RUBAR
MKISAEKLFEEKSRISSFLQPKMLMSPVILLPFRTSFTRSLRLSDKIHGTAEPEILLKERSSTWRESPNRAESLTLKSRRFEERSRNF